MFKKLAILLVLITVGGLGCKQAEQVAVPNEEKTAVEIAKEKKELHEAIQAASANDEDIDGLTNDEEKTYKTDQSLADTDGDGLSDYDEVKGAQTDPLKPDTDGDGKTDGYEVRRGQNPKAK